MDIIKVPNLKRVFLFLLVLSVFDYGNVFAQLLDEIYIQPGTDRVIATIKMTGPVHNVRSIPAKKGTTLEILLDKVPNASVNDEWFDNEVIKSPPSNLIPSFTVKTNLKNIQPKLLVEFSREAEFTIHTGRDGRSVLLSIKIDKVVPRFEGGLPVLPEVKPLTPAASELNKQAAALMQKGRHDLAESDNFAAIDAFNKLLFLPPNDYTQDGQEWVGVARERAGQPDKAKVEYELYLKLYPSGESFDRVKVRLSLIGTKPPSKSVTAEGRAQRKQINQTLSYGSMSMHYYRGASKIDSAATTTFASAQAPTSVSLTDQSALLTTVVATKRYISEEYDNRLVFQDTAYSNFLPGQSSKNRLGAAYFEVKNRLSDYSARLGRQSSSGAGVMGRFDGVSGGFGLTPTLRVNAVAGQLSDYSFGSKPVFYGASMDMGPVTVYAINQTVEGVLDRRAVGTELRYFEATKTAFVLLDYDTSYATLNTAMLQATYNPNADRTYNLLLDHRKAPYISTRNALFGATTSSIAELLQIMSEEDLRALAASRTGVSNLAQIGVLQKLSEKWQFGGDFRASSYDGLQSSGSVNADGTPTLAGLYPETPSSGNELAITPQLIGSGLYSSRDITVFSLSYISSPLYRGQSFYVYSRGFITDKWTLDATLQYYRQNYESGSVLTRTMPAFRTAYQIRQTLSLDAEVGLEFSHSQTDTQVSDSQRQFLSFGFRWDF